LALHVGLTIVVEVGVTVRVWVSLIAHLNVVVIVVNVLLLIWLLLVTFVIIIIIILLIGV